MSAYRGRVGQGAVEALTWRCRHHDVIVTLSVIIGRSRGTDPRGIVGGSSVTCLERYGVRSAIRTIVPQRSTRPKRAQGSVQGFRCSGGPGLIGGLGDVGHWRSEPVGRVEVVKGKSV